MTTMHNPLNIMNYTASLLPCTSWSEWLHTCLWFQGTLEAAFCLYTMSTKEFEPATFAVFRQAFDFEKRQEMTRVTRDALKPQALAASAIPHCQTWVMTWSWQWSYGFLKIQGRCPTGVLARQQRRSPFKIFKPGWGHPSSSAKLCHSTNPGKMQTTGLKMKTTTVVHYYTTVSQIQPSYVFLFVASFCLFSNVSMRLNCKHQIMLDASFFATEASWECHCQHLPEAALSCPQPHSTGQQIASVPEKIRHNIMKYRYKYAAINVNYPGFILSSLIPAAPYNPSCIS